MPSLAHSHAAPMLRPGAPTPLLYRFEAQLDVVPIGRVPEGIRMANSFEGRVVEGILPGARVWGIDHLLLRADGVSIIDAQKTISLGTTHLYEHVHGYCLPPSGMELPPLEVLLDPDFEWPDVLFPIIGSSTFRAAAPSLQHLNGAVATIQGWASFATGGLAIETRLPRTTTPSPLRLPSPAFPLRERAADRMTKFELPACRRGPGRSRGVTRIDEKRCGAPSAGAPHPPSCDTFSRRKERKACRIGTFRLSRWPLQRQCIATAGGVYRPHERATLPDPRDPADRRRRGG